MPTLELRIPAELGDAGLLDLLAAVEFFPAEPPDEIIIRVEGVKVWREPAVRALLAACIACHPRPRILSVGPLSVADVEGWIDFYAALGEPFRFAGISPPPSPGRFFPLRWVASVTELNLVSREVAAVLTDEENARSHLKYLVGELLENALHHAEWERGALVGAQLLPATERAQVVIVDCGRGIRQHLSQNPTLRIADDGEALDLALRPWVTGTAGQSRLDRAGHGHVGCGLPVAAGLVVEAGGVMLLASGGAGVRLDREGRRPVPIRPWRGTVVVLDVWRPGLRDYPQAMERVRKSLGPRPRIQRLRFR